MKRNGKRVGKEHMTAAFALTAGDAVGLPENEFDGIASVFGSLVETWTPTVLEPGAFATTLERDRARIRILWQHDTDSPIGLPTLLEETPQGLHIRGRISKTMQGQEALTLMRDGVVSELSIGFDAVREFTVNDPSGLAEPVRHLQEVKLWEISLVTFAADPMARVAAVHAVVPYQDLPLASEDRAWDRAAAEARVRRWAGGEASLDDMDWPRYRKAYLWFDAENAQAVSGYKLQIGDILDGDLVAVPRGLFAVAVVLQGGRGGADIPADEQDRIETQVSRYYRRMDRVAPWDQDAAPVREALEPILSLTLAALATPRGRSAVDETMQTLRRLCPVDDRPARRVAQLLRESELDYLAVAGPR